MLFEIICKLIENGVQVIFYSIIDLALFHDCMFLLLIAFKKYLKYLYIRGLIKKFVHRVHTFIMRKNEGVKMHDMYL